MSKVLLISTGGTITMVRDRKSHALVPADMETFKAFMPELFAGEIQVDIEAFSPLIDSSDINPDCWVRMAQMVYDRYGEYDGFVILHGTDTMSYFGFCALFHAREPVQTRCFYRLPTARRSPSFGCEGEPVDCYRDCGGQG